MWTEAQIVEFTNTEIIPFAKKAKAVVDYVVASKDIAKIAHAIPSGDKVLKALGGVDNALGMATKALPYVGTLFTVYELYRGFGGQPMDLSRPEFRDYLKDYDARTGG